MRENYEMKNKLSKHIHSDHEGMKNIKCEICAE